MSIRAWAAAVAVLLAFAAAAAAQTSDNKPTRRLLPTAPRAQRPSGLLTPTPGIGGPGAELEAMQVAVMPEIESGLVAFADPDAQADGARALDAAYEKLRAMVKRAEALAKQRADEAAEAEKQIASLQAAVAVAVDIESARQATADVSTAQQRAIRLRIGADAAAHSVARQVAALKQYSAGVKDRDPLAVRNATGLLSMEVRRTAQALAPVE